MNKYEKYTLIALRIIIGLMFFYVGMNKLVNDFSATGYLENATTGPFKEIFRSMAGLKIIDFLVVGGEIAIGLIITVGIMVRFASVMGILMMILLYSSSLPQDVGPISQHIIYIFVFALLFAFNAGKYFGIDKFINYKKRKLEFN